MCLAHHCSIAEQAGSPIRRLAIFVVKRFASNERAPALSVQLRPFSDAFADLPGRHFLDKLDLPCLSPSRRFHSAAWIRSSGDNCRDLAPRLVLDHLVESHQLVGRSKAFKILSQVFLLAGRMPR